MKTQQTQNDIKPRFPERSLNPKGRIMKQEIEKYIKGIRNTEKKRYAVDYMADIICHDNRTEIREYSLGQMAKQAVRMNINEMMEA